MFIVLLLLGHCCILGTLFSEKIGTLSCYLLFIQNGWAIHYDITFVTIYECEIGRTPLTVET